MYNLIMWGDSDKFLKEVMAKRVVFRAANFNGPDNVDGDGTPTGELMIDQDRFLEYTNDDLKNKFSPLDDSKIKQIKEFPTLITPEHQGDNGCNGYLAVITKIENRQQQIRVEFRLNSKLPLIPTQHLHDHLFDFDLGRLEVNRSHWAIKNVDLFQALNKAGIPVSQKDFFAEEQKQSDKNFSDSVERPVVPRMHIIYQLNVLISVLSQNIDGAEKRTNFPPVLDLALGSNEELIEEIRKLRDELAEIKRWLSSDSETEPQTSLPKEALRELVLKFSGEIGTGFAKAITLPVRFATCYLMIDLMASYGLPQADLYAKITNMFQND